MFLDHCVNLLYRGQSSASQDGFTPALQVYFKLESGVSAKKLDSLKTALLMIEVIKSESDQDDKLTLFNNFTKYIFDHFSEPQAMALVKYAIADRHLTIKNLSQCASWTRISGAFRPVMLDNSKNPQELSKYACFERIYKRLKGLGPLSTVMHDYVAHHAHEIEETAFH